MGLQIDCAIFSGDAYSAGQFSANVGMAIVTDGMGEAGAAAEVGDAAEGAAEAGSADLGDLGATECFTAGTPVVMADGSTKKIEDVKAGDKVATRDAHADEMLAVSTGTVTRTFVHPHDGTLLLSIDGASVETTPEHLFYVSGKGFVPAEQLERGERVSNSVVQGRTQLPFTKTVYNFEVGGTHTYFIRAAGHSIWVHNDCVPPDGIFKDDWGLPSDGSVQPQPGYEWKGQPGSLPGSPDGSWWNPTTKESLHPDLNHPDPIGPHWDYKDPAMGDKGWRLFPDGTLGPKP
jgi:hypothetical protein